MKESEAVSREYMIQGLAKELLLARVATLPTALDIAECFVKKCEDRLAPLEDALAAHLAEELLDRRDTEPPDGESECGQESESEDESTSRG
jgi:hypothetical protein